MENIFETSFVESRGESVEVLWNRPQGVRRLPLVLIVHGHMENRLGAKIHQNFLSSRRLLEKWGVCIASVSQPGYGLSSGSPDYCGPKTQRAVIDVINYFRSQKWIDPKKIALVGYSRGAIVASMVATKTPDLAALILGSGFYDFSQYYEAASLGIKKAIENECGLGASRFEERSALLFSEKIKSPTLIFHGAKDERGGWKESQKLHRLLTRNNVRAEGVFLDQIGHQIPIRKFIKETKIFLKRELANSGV